MTPFQWILVSSFAALAALATVAVVAGRLGRVAGLFWVAAFVVGGLAAIEPDRVTTVANALGIHRGADLLLYLLVLAVFWGFLLVYVRLRRVRRELTVLVRHVAILEAEQGGSDPTRTDASTAESPSHH